MFEWNLLRISSQLFAGISLKFTLKEQTCIVIFMPAASKSSVKNGMFVFISSNKWLRAGYGSNLRRYLTFGFTIESITDFGDLPVF